MESVYSHEGINIKIGNFSSCGDSYRVMGGTRGSFSVAKPGRGGERPRG